MTYYLPNGDEVELVRVVDGGYLVRKIVCFNGETITLDDVHFEPNVDTQPPTPKRSAEDVGLRVEIECKQAVLHALCHDIAMRERELEKMKRVWRNHDALKTMTAFVEGKVTHLVMTNEWHPPRLEPMSNRWKRGMLIVWGNNGDDRSLWWEREICPETGRSEQWRVEMFVNEQDARARLAALYNEAFELYRDKEQMLERYVKAADKAGFAISDCVLDRLRALKGMRAMCDVIDAKKKLADAQEALKRLEDAR